MPLMRSVILNAALVCAANIAAFAQNIDPAIRDVLSSPELKGTLKSRITKEVWAAKDGHGGVTIYTFDDYELRIANVSHGTGPIGIFKGGTLIYTSPSESGLELPSLLFEPARELDLDGDGSLDIVVGSYSGGMHCCYTYQVLSFAPEFRVGATLDGGASPFEIVGDGDFAVLRGTDGVLGYWHTDFANGIFSDVYVVVNGDDVALADEWMKYPPSEEEWTKIQAESAAAFATKENWMKDPENGEPPFAPRVLMQHAVKLIYSGNGEYAFHLLKETWKGDATRPSVIALDLLTQLSKSRYWDSIRSLNGWTGEPAAIAQAGLKE